MNIIELNQSIKQIVTDRPFLLLGIGVLLVGIVGAIVVGASIHGSDVTVYSRYTAFGEAHFYKSHWQYLLLFVLFDILVAVSHVTLMIKLYSIERRQTALLLGWVGVAIIIIGVAYALSVIRLGQVA